MSQPIVALLTISLAGLFGMEGALDETASATAPAVYDDSVSMHLMVSSTSRRKIGGGPDGHKKTCCAWIEPGQGRSFEVSECPDAGLRSWAGDTLQPKGVWHWYGVHSYKNSLDNVQGPHNCVDGVTDEWEFPPFSYGLAATRTERIATILYTGVNPNVPLTSAYVFEWKEVDNYLPDDKYKWYTNAPGNWVTTCAEASKRGSATPGYNGTYDDIDVGSFVLTDDRGAGYGQYDIGYKVSCTLWNGIDGDPCGNGVCAFGETPEICAVDCAPPENPGVCGDGTCGLTETPGNCQPDCKVPTPKQRNSRFVSSHRGPGGSYPYVGVAQARRVAVTFQNTGRVPWTSGTGFELGSQNPPDSATWGFGRVALPEDVGPGETVTFDFDIEAPPTTGTYSFQWRMLHDGVAFGAISPDSYVQVVPIRSSHYQYGSNCAVVAPGRSCTVSVLMRNYGAESWSSQSGHSLGMLAPNGMAGPARIGVAEGTRVENWNPSDRGRAKGQYRFTFEVTAPPSRGVFRSPVYSMVKEQEGEAPIWFGDKASRELWVGNPDRLCGSKRGCEAACGAFDGVCEYKGNCGGFKCFLNR